MRSVIKLLFLITCMIPPSLVAETYIGGAITTNTTLTVAGSPYTVTSDLKIGYSSMVTLTIEPGCELRFNPGTGLYVGWYGNYTKYGHLVANGTETDRIVFTSNAEVPQPGDWKGIKYTYASYNSNTLLNCDIKYAGGEDTVWYSVDSCAILLESPGSSPTYKKLDGCVIDSTLGTGIYLNKATDSVLISNTIIRNSTEYGFWDDAGRSQPLRMENCIIQYNSSGGVRIDANTSSVQLTNNYISYNGGYPVILRNQQNITDLFNNTYLGNDIQAVYLQGHGSGIGASVFRNDGLPYVIDSDLKIGYYANNYTLTIGQ